MHGRFFEPLIELAIALAEHPQTHQAHNLGRTQNIVLERALIMDLPLEIHCHAVEKSLDQVRLDIETVDGLLKTVQHGVDAKPISDGPKGLAPEIPSSTSWS